MLTCSRLVGGLWEENPSIQTEPCQEMDDFEDEDNDEAVRKRMERQALSLKYADKLPSGKPRYEDEG